MNSNEETKTCPICGKNFEWFEAVYCPYCGIDLHNYCTNTECEENPTNHHHEYNAHLDNDFKYCPVCGSKTTYFDFLSKED